MSWVMKTMIEKTGWFTYRVKYQWAHGMWLSDEPIFFRLKSAIAHAKRIEGLPEGSRTWMLNTVKMPED